MSTLAQITAAIDDDIRNKTPLVLKVEHADVEQLITDEMFPDTLTFNFNGTAQTSGLPNVAVFATLAANWKVLLTVKLEKIGNRVFYNGFITSTETGKALGNIFGIILATFPTTTYQPTDRSISGLIGSAGANQLPNAYITFIDDGIILKGSIPISSDSFYFEGSYKVAN